VDHPNRARRRARSARHHRKQTNSAQHFPQAQTGQPDQSREDLGNQPGQSIDASGAAFDPDGTSGGVYAGNQNPINDKNTASVSPYDVACEMNHSAH
jgi:hypothetical protein